MTIKKWLVLFCFMLGAAMLSGCSGSSNSLAANPADSSPVVPAAFVLTSEAGVDGGALPVEYTCDGSGVSPALAWANPPAGTKEYALLMTTLPGDGTTKWNWVLYNIPATASGLAKNSSGVGTAGVGSDGPTRGYQPPCSQGPGAKKYTFTLYALSASPQLPSAPDQVTGAGVTQAISNIILGSAALNLSYTRDPGTAPTPGFSMTDTISDEAQRTTLAFSGLAMLTGNLQAQTFFPPGKVADYTGFQYLRDNDPDNMGHNTSFLTRVANNIIYVLNDSQFDKLKNLAVAQQTQIDNYGYQRYPMMKAFRRLIDGNLPAGSTGLNLNAVKKASRALYLIDGQISYDRAVLYAEIISSLDATQKAYLESMKGKGWSSWPDITNDQIRSRMQGLPQGTAVAVMTYASDLFSWYAGSVEADVYFCPERQGTYYGSFYIKDAPAIGHEGYSINEQLTATAGSALCDSTKGYVSAEQAAVISSLVDTQRGNLYASPTANIVKIRTDIATSLRQLLQPTADKTAIKARVLELSGVYGDLDGENNYHYATVFSQVYKTLTPEQKARLAELRKSIMSGYYADGTPFDYSVSSQYYLYSAVISDQVVAPYINNTDYLFFEP
jgi:phosphatidylethanolamine-binding protein (PEBP) family uncharacterized protein